MKRTNKILALLLALLLVVSVLPLSTAAAGESIAETTDPNAISTADEFVQKLSANPSGAYYLTNDIDFNGKTFTTPYVINEFYGTLDGNGYSIKNVNLSYTGNSETVEIGLIGKIGNDDLCTKTAPTVISDLTIEKMNITINPSGGGMYLAAGFLTGGTSNFRVKCPVISGVHVKNSKIDATVPEFKGCVHHTNNYNRPGVSIGGIAGAMTSIVSISDCSLDKDTEIKVVSTANSRDLTVAGMVGALTGSQVRKSGDTSTVLYPRTSVIDGCVNSAKISVNYTYDTTQTWGVETIGGMVGNVVSFYVIMNCVNNGELTVTPADYAKVGAILACASQGNNLSLIAKCSSTWNNLEIFGAKAGGVKSYKNMVGSNGTATTASTQNDKYNAITTANDLIALSGTDANEIYALEPADGSNVIDLGADEYIASFNGIFYGNGVTVKGAFKNEGLFKSAGTSRLTVIADLNLDITMTVNNSGSHGALISSCGGLSVVVSNVNVNADVTLNTSCNFGGLIGHGKAPRVFNCSVSGTIKSVAGGNVSAFIGHGDNNGFGTDGLNAIVPTVLVNCNSFVDITIGENATTVSNVGAFFGYTGSSWGIAMLNCANFGDITAKSEGHKIGGLIGVLCIGYNGISNCADYGNIGTSYAGIGEDEQFSVYVHNFNNSLIRMQYGASLRIDDESGIRFKSNINVDAYDKLVARYGKDAVSIGTLITPAAFVTAANGIFTKDALDALIEEKEDLFTSDSVPYIDVTADAWFNDEEGVIAGSVLNLEGLYSDEFVGRAYIKVTDGENVEFYYADFYEDDIANNSRSVEYLANAAASDILYRKDGVSYFIVDGQSIEVTDADIIATYTTVIKEEDGCTAYSCYTAEQYAKFSQFLGVIG